MSLDKKERDDLLRLARAEIARVLGADERGPGEKGSGAFFAAADEKGTRPLFPEAGTRPGGAFVSIHIGDHLRGCVGYPESDLPLTEVIQRCAVSAATSDTRFPALNPSELPLVSIEISVLGPIEPVADISEIEVGRHGLIAQLGHRRGLLLPQVATEWSLGPEEFAGHTCRKAGLLFDAWRTGAQLFKFEAEVFGDP